MDEEMRATVRLTQQEKYRFAAEMEEPQWTVVADEPPPLGGGRGPNAARLIATAVGHCLSASLLFCLEKSRVRGVRLSTTVHAAVRRNERGRWRLAALDVHIDAAGLDPDRHSAFQRCREIFEDYCIVTASVRQGIPVGVTVTSGGERSDGQRTGEEAVGTVPSGGSS